MRWTNRRVLFALRDQCRQWGGELTLVNALPAFDHRRGGVNPCPFDGDVLLHWERKLIIAWKSTAWPTVIHEMGHTFACNAHPAASREWLFFGWELALAQRFDVAVWLRHNADYIVTYNGNYVSFGHLNKEAQQEVLATATTTSQRAGLLVDGQPIPTR